MSRSFRAAAEKQFHTLGAAKAAGVYLRSNIGSHSFQKPMHATTANSTPHGRDGRPSNNVTIVADSVRPRSSKVASKYCTHSDICCIFAVVSNSKAKTATASPQLNPKSATKTAAKKATASIRLAAKPHSMNTSLLDGARSPGVIVPTINNYVNITAIGSPAGIPSFMTIPAKLRQAYFISPVMQQQTTTATHVPAKSGTGTGGLGKKRLSVKTSDQRRKPAVPSKSEKHSKQPSLNTSIGELIKGDKGTQHDINFSSIKVKDLTEMHKRQQYKVVVTKYAFYSKVGRMPGNAVKQNQDSFLVNPKILGSYSQHLFGIADGHGQFGKEVSSTVKQKYPGNFPGLTPSVFLEECLKSMPVTDALTQAFALSNKEVSLAVDDIEFSGSTSAMVFINGQELFTANVGDSRAILCSVENGGSAEMRYSVVLQGKAITRDHKPDEPDEAARILSQGGRIEPFKDGNGEHVGPLRVWQKDQDIPGLAMTRAMGDGAGVVAGVIAAPGIADLGNDSDRDFQVLAGEERPVHGGCKRRSVGVPVEPGGGTDRPSLLRG